MCKLALAVPVLLATACASARTVLEQPVGDRCASSGLRGCADLTEGVLLYVEGEDAAGEARVRWVVRRNSPDGAMAFADALGRLPDAGAYAASLREIAAMIRADVSQTATPRVEAAPEPRPLPPVPTAAPPPPRPRDNLSRWRGGTVVPAADALATRCPPMPLLPAVGRLGHCVRVAQGPLVITELYVPGGCPSYLYAVGGSISEPKWTVFAPVWAPLNVTGASLLVREGESFTVGVAGPSEAQMERDVRCSVTWAGWRPAHGATPVPGAGIPASPYR